MPTYEIISILNKEAETFFALCFFA